MSAADALELGVERRADGRIALLAPDVGLLTCALAPGTGVTPGQVAGVLHRLGRASELRVPPGAAGRVVSARPERILAPVGYGDPVAVLAPEAEAHGSGACAGEADSGGEGKPGSGALVYRSAHAGRFYRRPSPDREPFVGEGSIVEPGTPLGMIEVMKTFSHVAYERRPGLPERARVVSVRAADGSDVAAGDALLEVEPA